MGILSIVNEKDEVIGQEERKVIHEKGLLHREVNLWFITPNHKIIFQKRGIDKETFAGLFDATVAGHVEIGESYEDTAIREAKEETGVDILKEDLVFINKKHETDLDNVKGLINNKFTAVYKYIYTGKIEDLKLEDKGALGFESFSIDQLSNLSGEEKEKFIEKFITKEFIELFKTVI